MISHTNNSIHIFLLSLIVSLFPSNGAERQLTNFAKPSSNTIYKLCKSIQNGKYKEVKESFENYIYDPTMFLSKALQGCDPSPYNEMRDFFDYNLFHFVVSEGSAAMLWLYLEHYPSLLKVFFTKTKGEHGRTALHIAAEKGKEDMVYILINLEMTPLRHKVAMLWFNKRYKGVEQICLKYVGKFEIPKGQKLSEIKTNNGHYPFQLAFKKNHAKAIKVFLQLTPFCLEIMSSNDSFLHPFLSAVNKGNTEVAKAFLEVDYKFVLEEVGSNCKALIYVGMNAFHLAANHGYDKLLEVFFNQCEKDKYDKDKLVEKVVKNNKKGNIGLNILHLAIINGHLKAIKRILRYAPSLIDQEVKEGRWCGHTPISMATIMYHCEILKELLTLDKDRTLVKKVLKCTNDEWQGSTVLHIATAKGSTIFSILLKHHQGLAYTRIENPDSKYNGWTPLHLLAKERRKKAVEILLNKVPDCLYAIIYSESNSDYNGLNALHLCVDGSPKMVKILLEYDYKHSLASTVVQGNKLWGGYNAFLMSLVQNYNMVKIFLDHNLDLIFTKVKNPKSPYKNLNVCEIAQKNKNFLIQKALNDYMIKNKIHFQTCHIL